MSTEASVTRRRAGAGLLAAVLALALGAAGWTALRRGVLEHPATPAAAPEVPTGTARVTRTDVVQRQDVPGVLGYGTATNVVAQSAGDASGGPGAPGSPVQPLVPTRLPAPGTVVRRDQALYELNGRPVVLWYGARPAWRAFGMGMADGQDVRQLEANLVALRFDPDRTVTVDDHFSAATRAAVRRWQAGALGLPPLGRTGEIPLGGVVFFPGPVRVATVAATLGAPLAPGAPVLSVTPTRPVITAGIDPALQELVRAGNRVRVVLPDGRASAGTVAAVSRVATSPVDAEGRQGGNGGVSDPTQAVISVTVRLADPRAARGLDQAPVQVAITTQAHTRVLAVPIAALLARPEGGYAVEVVGPGAASRRVPVRTGLFDETAGLVEVAGAGLAEGLAVEVPAP
jgi:Putative peptidoglycan binding domain/HlyD family secretion protein